MLIIQVSPLLAQPDAVQVAVLHDHQAPCSMFALVAVVRCSYDIGLFWQNLAPQPRFNLGIGRHMHMIHPQRSIE